MSVTRAVDSVKLSAGGMSSGLTSSGSRGWVRSSGSVSRKHAPLSGSAHTSSRPPCSRVSSVAIASPRPVPPTVRARAGSPRQNLLNTFAVCSSVIPMPWSRTATATQFSLAAT